MSKLCLKKNKRKAFISLVHHRRQELRELRLLQKEEQRAQQQLSNKLHQQKEQIYRRIEQETTVSHSTDLELKVEKLVLDLSVIFSSDLSFVFYVVSATLIIKDTVVVLF